MSSQKDKSMTFSKIAHYAGLLKYKMKNVQLAKDDDKS